MLRAVSVVRQTSTDSDEGRIAGNKGTTKKGINGIESKSWKSVRIKEKAT
jgi:hypothetical protein